MNGNMIGRVFNNRYQLTERIGVGGMAEVFRAQDRVLGRLVAVKVMLPQYASDPEFTQRFRQEAASAANLQSPYIVNVYDWGQDEGTYYIVMEYVRGSDLKTAIKQRGAINQRKVAEIGAQVCKALSVAHNLDIIHRDIKPQNIMVQPDGNVKVMDFGIARAKNSLKSQTGAVLGTAHYISPEQAQGKELTPASDIYSLGVVMYEAATGQLPFDGPDAVSVATKQVQETPVPPRQINPNIDPGLEAIIMRAMEKDPLARFATANDMKHALNDFLAGRPVNLGEEETRVMNGAYAAPAQGTSVMPAPASASSQYPTTYDSKNGSSPTSSKKKMSGKSKALIAIIAAIAAILVIFGIASALSSSDTTVPDVTNQSQAQAEQTLESAGFTVGTVTEVYDSNVSAGNVVSTDPAAGTSAAEGSTVNLNVSKGKEQVEVPDLTNMTAEQARQALAQRGLTAQQGSSVSSSTVSEGNVVSQDPAGGTKVDANSTVTFSLSSGPEKVTVPDVTGQSQSKATSTLQGLGLDVSVSTSSSDTVDEGYVISQNPNSGSVEVGSTVSIVVSTGSASISVPDVTGQSESAAESTLANRGFKYDVQYQSSSSVSSGIVISQSPKSGSSAKAGDTITIVVSTGPDSSNSSSGNNSSNSSSGSGNSSSSNNSSAGA